MKWLKPVVSVLGWLVAIVAALKCFLEASPK
jgi:hypothetical protein